MRLTRTWTGTLSVLTIFILLLSACSDDESQPPPEGTVGEEAPGTTEMAGDDAEPPGTTEMAGDDAEPIIIGVAVSFTGFIAPFDQPALQFLQFRVEEINEAGGLLGRPIEIVTSDARSDIQQGAVAGQEVLEQGADFVFVTCDFDFGGGAASVANDAGVVVFSPCAASPKFGVEGIGPYAFTMAYGTPAEGAVMAEWAYSEAGWRTTYLLVDETIEYSRDSCASFEARWIQMAGEDSVIGRDTFLNDDPSIDSQITRIRGLDEEPDFVALCSFIPGGAQALRQIRAAGLDLPIVSGQGLDGSFWLDAVPNLSDLYYVTYASAFGNDPDQQVNELIAKYTEETGEQLNQAQAITGYSVMEALERAIERAGSTDSDLVKAELEKFDGEPLLVGPTTFTPDLHINMFRTLTVLQVQDGEHSVVTRWTPEQVPGYQQS